MRITLRARLASQIAKNGLLVHRLRQARAKVVLVQAHKSRRDGLIRHPRVVVWPA